MSKKNSVRMIPEHEVAEFAQDYKKANEIVLQKLEKSKAQVEVTLQKLAQKQGEYEYMKKQLAEYGGRVEAWEQAIKQDINDYKSAPKIVVCVCAIFCLVFVLTATSNAVLLQSVGMFWQVLALVVGACNFAALSCILAFALARTKQHTIDYLQHIKPPQKQGEK